MEIDKCIKDSTKLKVVADSPTYSEEESQLYWDNLTS